MSILKHEVRKGYRVELTFSWKNPDGTPMNLTGMSLRATLRDDYFENGSTAVVDLVQGTPVAGSEVAWVNQAAGQCRLRFSPTHTASFVGGKNYYWELQVLEIGNGNHPIRGVAGVFAVQPTVYYNNP